MPDHQIAKLFGFILFPTVQARADESFPSLLQKTSFGHQNKEAKKSVRIHTFPTSRFMLFPTLQTRADESHPPFIVENQLWSSNEQIKECSISQPADLPFQPLILQYHQPYLISSLLYMGTKVSILAGAGPLCTNDQQIKSFPPHEM